MTLSDGDPAFNDRAERVSLRKSDWSSLSSVYSLASKKMAYSRKMASQSCSTSQ